MQENLQELKNNEILITNHIFLQFALFDIKKRRSISQHEQQIKIITEKLYKLNKNSYGNEISAQALLGARYTIEKELNRIINEKFNINKFDCFLENCQNFTIEQTENLKRANMELETYINKNRILEKEL